MTKKKVTVAAVVAAVLVAIGLVAANKASASTIPSNFPGNNGVCDAWHGAPGGFGPDSPYYTISAPHGGVGGYTFGQRQGENTGDNNSGYAAFCNAA